MTRAFVILLVVFVASSFIHPNDESAVNSPSPEGDTRMGADAATSGTDITDKELQAQEEKGILNIEESRLKKEDPTEENRTNINVK